MTEKKTDAAELARINGEIEEAITHEPSEQYLTFYVDKEEYGVDILSVQEIRGWEPATAIPNAPDYVKGVINLRGTVVPIIDLRRRFGIKQFDYSSVTVVIVVKVKAGNREKVMGIVVDAVSEVSNFDHSNIQAAPELTDNKNTAFVKGLGSTEESMVILLDINKLLSTDEDLDLSGIRQATPA